MSTVFQKDKLEASNIETVLATTDNPVTYQVDGDLDTDVIIITGIGINGTDETDLYIADGSAVLTLTQTRPWYTFYAPARLKIFKPSGTTNNVGLMKISK